MRIATSNGGFVSSISTVQLLKAIVCVGAVATLAGRVWIMSDLPLWLDETWSAMIASQPTWASFWREAWLDCNPPLYYVLLRLWTSIAGDSNIALRLPSFLFTTLAALAALKGAPRKLGETGAWTWAALILFWMYSLILSVDARGYGLLLLLSTLACLQFAKLYERLNLRVALLWVVLADLMFLTHYYSGTLIAAQGLLLFYRHRLQVLSVWSAGLAAIPALAWFVFQAPRLKDYARPDVAWYDPLTLGNGLRYTQYLFGHPAPSFIPLVLLTLVVGLSFNRRTKSAELGAPVVPAPGSPALWATAASGLLGLVLAFAVGILQASLTGRYLVPLVPPTMLGLVMVALQSNKRQLICTLLVSYYLMSSLNFIPLEEYAQQRNDYGYEKGSAFIAPYRPTQVVFAWDHPAAKILDRTSLEKIGGYFLHRSGVNFQTTALVLDEQDDPNLALAKAATGERPAIIWLYNTHRRSAARDHPPLFEENPVWSCRHDYQPDANEQLGAIACIKKGR